MDKHKILRAVALVFIIFLTCSTFGLSIGMIITGYHYRHECQIDPWLPYFLMIGGGATLLLLPLLALCVFVCKRNGHTTLSNNIFSFVAVLLLFLLVWNVAGTLRIYRNWNALDKKSNVESVMISSSKGCLKQLYLFSYSVIWLFWICVIGGGPCFCLLNTGWIKGVKIVQESV